MCVHGCPHSSSLHFPTYTPLPVWLKCGVHVHVPNCKIRGEPKVIRVALLCVACDTIPTPHALACTKTQAWTYYHNHMVSPSCCVCVYQLVLCPGATLWLGTCGWESCYQVLLEVLRLGLPVVPSGSNTSHFCGHVLSIVAGDKIRLCVVVP